MASRNTGKLQIFHFSLALDNANSFLAGVLGAPASRYRLIALVGAMVDARRLPALRLENRITENESRIDPGCASRRHVTGEQRHDQQRNQRMKQFPRHIVPPAWGDLDDTFG